MIYINPVSSVCVMASVHSRLVDMLTQIGRRIVRLEEMWNVKLEGQKVHVTDEEGGETDYSVVEHTEDTITLSNTGHKFQFKVNHNPQKTEIIHLSNGRRCTFDVNHVGVGQYTVEDGLVSLHQRELFFRADEQTQMNSMRAEIARLRTMTTVEDIPTPEIVKYYEENLSEPVDDVNEEWHDMVWKTAVETSALRGLLAMRKREFARVGGMDNNQVVGEIDLLNSKLESKTMILSGICKDHSIDISVQLYKELDSFHKLVEELFREKEYWSSSKKKDSRVETANYQLAIDNTHRYKDYHKEVERIGAEITKEVTDALTREAEEKAKAKVEEDSQVKDNIQAPPKVEKPTPAQLQQQIADMRGQIATLDHEINQTLPSSMQKEFKAINKLSDELIKEHRFKPLKKYTGAIQKETDYWEKQLENLQLNPDLILFITPAQEQYDKLRSLGLPIL